MVTSLQTGEPQNNIFVRGDKVYKNSTSGAWCSLYYQFSYQISDTNKLTVSERDYCIGGMVQSIQEFWENTELRELIELNEKVKEMQVINQQLEQQKANTLSIAIEDLNLSVRSYNCLKRYGIQTIQELTNMTKSQVEKINNLGKKSLREIQKQLTDYGLTFKDE